MSDTNNRAKPAHLVGIGLDNQDGHKRLTQAEQFTVAGGSEETHDKITETLVKTFEDLDKKGKSLNNVEREELTDIISKNIPQ